MTLERTRKATEHKLKIKPPLVHHPATAIWLVMASVSAPSDFSPREYRTYHPVDSICDWMFEFIYPQFVRITLQERWCYPHFTNEEIQAKGMKEFAQRHTEGDDNSHTGLV